MQCGVHGTIRHVARAEAASCDRSVLVLGERVVSGSDDHSVRVWSAEYGHCLFAKFRHTTPVHCIQALDR